MARRRRRLLVHDLRPARVKRFTDCLLPGSLYLLAALAASRYPFTRAMQQEVAKSLDPRGPEIMD